MTDIQRRLAIVADDLLAANIQYSAALQAFKRAFIKQAMLAHRGHQSKTAAVIGVHRNTLCRAMDECELPISECRKPPARVPGFFAMERQA